MKLSAQELLLHALQLSPRARADIAGTLLRSLDDVEERDVDAAWQAEVEKRLKDIDAGQAKLVSWSIVERSARAKIQRSRAAR